MRARFEAANHHVLATLRRDGSPRVSGTEVNWHGPDLVLGMMPGSLKARDLQHDGRFALHAHTGDGTLAGGDAKIAGEAMEEVEADRFQAYADEVKPPLPSHLFRLRLGQVVLTSLNAAGDRLVIQTWRPGRGVDTVERT